MFHLCHNQFGSSFLFVYLLVLFRENISMCVCSWCIGTCAWVCVCLCVCAWAQVGAWCMEHAYVCTSVHDLCMHAWVWRAWCVGAFMWRSEDNCVEAGFFKYVPEIELRSPSVYMKHLSFPAEPSHHCTVFFKFDLHCLPLRVSE